MYCIVLNLFIPLHRDYKPLLTFFQTTTYKPMKNFKTIAYISYNILSLRRDKSPRFHPDSDAAVKNYPANHSNI